jgi:hypothetical protein
MAHRKSTTKAAHRVEIPATGKFFYRDRETGDYPMYLNGELQGFATSAEAAERELNRLAYEQVRRAA